MNAPLLLPSLAIAFFLLGCFVTATVCAVRSDPLGDRHRLNDALAESVALREELAAVALPNREDHLS